MDITDINDVYFNADLKITKFDHKKFTKYREVKKKAPLTNLIFKGLNNKLGKVFSRKQIKY